MSQWSNRGEVIIIGVYDILPAGAQLKCWNCEMKEYKVGDGVPPCLPYADYILLLREGGFVRVQSNKIVEIQEVEDVYYYPEDFPEEICFDKWGDRVDSKKDLEGTEVLGDDYYWKEKDG